METSAGEVSVYRKTFNVLVQADSYEDARRRFSEFAGDVLSPGGCNVVIEEFHGFEGDDTARFFEAKLERWVGYPGIAAALADSLKKAERAFADLAGSVTFDDYFEYEISFEVADGSPPKEGTMQARP